MFTYLLSLFTAKKSLFPIFVFVFVFIFTDPGKSLLFLSKYIYNCSFIEKIIINHNVVGWDRVVERALHYKQPMATILQKVLLDSTKMGKSPDI